MDVDSYRLAYNVFHCNWERFGIPSKDIPPPKTEIVDSLDTVIPGFSIAVALFQIASRKELKIFLDGECSTVHNLSDVYTRFENIMSQALPEGIIGVDSPNDSVYEDQSKDTTSEDVSPDTMEEYLSEDGSSSAIKEALRVVVEENLPNDDMKEDLQKDNMKEDLQKDNMKEDLQKDNMKEDLQKDNMKVDLQKGATMKSLLDDVMKECKLKDTKKEGLLDDDMKGGLPEITVQKGQSGNMIRSEDIPGLIAYSLAVCIELVLYEREKENNRDYMKFMPDMWKEYFDKSLKPLCKEAHCNQDHLKSYSNSIKCPERFLNTFVNENKNEYNDISDKFYGYTEKNYAIESPEESKFFTGVGNFPKGLSFLKIKKSFTALKEVCKCVKALSEEEMPLLPAVSPDSTSSTSTTPSI